MNSDNIEKTSRVTKVLEAHPEATKHTVPDEQPHVPIDSPLIRQEISKHMEETWLPKRVGSFPIDEERSRPGSTVIFSNSMTCAGDLNPYKFREIANAIKDGGAMLPIHVLGHDDEQRYLNKVEEERASPKIRVEIETKLEK